MRFTYFAAGLTVAVCGTLGLLYLQHMLPLVQIFPQQIQSGESMYSDYIDSMTAPYMRVAPGMIAVAMLGGAGVAIFGIISSSKREDNNTEVKVYLSSGSTEKVFCRNCGRMGLVSSNFCPSCGIDQRPSPNASKHCTHCGMDVSSESAFCSLCGWKF